MEDNQEVFPFASFDVVINKIKEGAFAYNSLQEYAVELIKRLDKDNNELISFDEFKEGLNGMSIFLTDHEINTLLRVFDHNKDGQISMEEFYNTIAEAVNEEAPKKTKAKFLR